MNRTFLSVVTSLLAIVFTSVSIAKPAESLDILKMTSVPDGTYSATLEIDGTPVQAEFRIRNNVARCLKSDKAPGDRELKGLVGNFTLIANGVFMMQMRNESFAATQFWAFKPDGSADIKEIPDRGEAQRAVPIVDKK
ncbi:MAG: hypothetical protein R3F19_09620 [Verrucomicrobiales bacterium]